MRVYLDNCSYNCPYDDQSQMRIHLETQAKLHIQDIIRSGEIELVTSYVLDFENSNNRSIQKMMAIEKFMKEYATVYVSNKNEKDISNLAKAIMETGIKEKDAYHVACAVMAECDYFDYTLWQREYFDKMESGEFAAKASAYADSHPFTGKAQIL